MKSKTILLLSAAAIGGSLFFLKSKLDQYLQVVKNLQFKIKDVQVNIVDVQGEQIIFTADVELFNPTNISIEVPGEKIILRKMHFKSSSGKYLGTAVPNLSNLDMPANGTRLITNIPASAPFSAIGVSISELAGLAANPENLNITTEVEVFGKIITI